MPEPAAVIHRVTQEEAYEKALALIKELRPVGHCGEPNLVAETLTALDFYVRNCLKPAASPVAGVSAEKLTDDQLLRFAFDAFGEDAYRDHMQRTVWKDGIDISVPSQGLRRLAAKLAQPSAEGDGWIADMPTAIIHPEVVAVWTKATSPEHQVSASMAIELQMWRAWGAKRESAGLQLRIPGGWKSADEWRKLDALPAAPVAKEGRES